jgi:hypothetical protein
VNTDELEHQLYRAERRVREIQTKLHRWATDAPNGACGEPDARPTGTSGSGGDPEKPTSRNTGRALRVDLTTSKSLGGGSICIGRSTSSARSLTCLCPRDGI